MKQQMLDQKQKQKWLEEFSQRNSICGNGNQFMPRTLRRPAGWIGQVSMWELCSGYEQFSGTEHRGSPRKISIPLMWWKAHPMLILPTCIAIQFLIYHIPVQCQASFIHSSIISIHSLSFLEFNLCMHHYN